jgi:TRAP-type mannitol/chloroaromatic compound transport system permease small subunit
MERLADRIDRLNIAVGRGAAWLVLFVVLVQFAIVVARYGLGLGSIWLTESVLYANAALFLLAAAWTLCDDGHVRVDIFYASASARGKALIDLCGALFLLLPFMAVLIWFSLPYVLRSWVVGEGSREASGLPALYLVKALIPLFALLLILQGIAQAIRAVAQLRR